MYFTHITLAERFCNDLHSKREFMKARGERGREPQPENCASYLVTEVLDLGFELSLLGSE